MRKFTILILLLAGWLTYGWGQKSLEVPTAKVDQTVEKSIRHHKAGPTWTILHRDTVTSIYNEGLGMCSDGTSLYLTNISRPRLYKIRPEDGVAIDSIAISGMPAASDEVGVIAFDITYDGSYFYFCNGNDTIYQIDPSTWSVTQKIALATSSLPISIAYVPEANNGNGGFWTAGYSDYNLRLYSRTGTLLDDITPTNLGKSYNIYGLSYIDSTLYALERYPQNIISINPYTKKQSAPIHTVSDDMSAWGNYYSYAIYTQKDLVMGTDTNDVLGIFFMSGFHIIYDLNTTKLTEAVGATVAGTNIPLYNKVNTPITVNANIVNAGSNSLTNFIFHYQINGAVYSDTITGKNISDYSVGETVNHSITYTPTIADTTESITLWLSELNNTTINSDTFTFVFNTYGENAVARVVLHEGFTSATCSPCLYGNRQLKTVLNAVPENSWACIKYQMNWPGNGDPYYISETSARRSYYSVSGVPYLAVDGDGSEFDNSPSDYTTNYFHAAQGVPSYVTLDGSLTWNGAKTFTVNVGITPVKDFSGSNRLFVALVEKETKNNVADEYAAYLGTYYDTSFVYVTKKFLSSTTGDVVSLKANELVSKDYEYTFNGEYRLPEDSDDPITLTTEHSVEHFENILAVYWVQNFATKAVLQAGKTNTNAAVKDYILNTGHVLVYPNPANNQVKIESASNIEKVTVYDIIGQEVLKVQNSTVLDVSNLSKGIYILDITTENGTITKKIVKR